jgi:hypothetical protein
VSLGKILNRDLTQEEGKSKSFIKKFFYNIHRNSKIHEHNRVIFAPLFLFKDDQVCKKAEKYVQ